MYILHDIIIGEMVEIESLDDAKKYIMDNYVEGAEIHPDFNSFTIYKEVGSVNAIANEDDVVTKIEVRIES